MVHGLRFTVFHQYTVRGTRYFIGTRFAVHGTRKLLTELSSTEDDILVRGEFLQAHRAARVQAVRADADLRTQPELVAVREPGGGIDEHRGRVHRLREPGGVAGVLRDDRIRMRRAVPADVVDRLLEGIHDAPGED